MYVRTLVRQGHDTWRFCNNLPFLCSANVKSVHNSILEFLTTPGVKWRMATSHPRHPFVDFLAWYGQWEVTGCACFLFSTILQQEGGQLLLVYNVAEHAGLQDHSVPDTMCKEELALWLSGFQTCNNEPLFLQTVERIGVGSHYYEQKQHLRHHRNWKIKGCGVPNPPSELARSMLRMTQKRAPLLQEQCNPTQVEQPQRGRKGRMELVQCTDGNVFDHRDHIEDHSTKADRINVRASIHRQSKQAHTRCQHDDALRGDRKEDTSTE